MTLTKKVVKTIIERCGDDGHTIYDADKLQKHGIPEELLKSVRKTHCSSPSGGPKSMIFTARGDVLLAVDGVYGLELLSRTAQEIGVDDVSNEFIGRGGRARKITENLKNWVAAQ